MKPTSAHETLGERKNAMLAWRLQLRVKGRRRPAPLRVEGAPRRVGHVTSAERGATRSPTHLAQRAGGFASHSPLRLVALAFLKDDNSHGFHYYNLAGSWLLFLVVNRVIALIPRVAVARRQRRVARRLIVG